MNVPSLARGFIGFLIIATPIAASAGEDVKLHEVDYQSWSQLKLGDPLPVGGPVIRVFSEGGDRFDFVGHTNQPVRFMGLLTGSCAKLNKVESLSFKVAETSASVSHPNGKGAWFSRDGVVDVPHHQLQGFDAVGMCNAKLKTLAAETGRSRRDLVGEGFGIHYPDWIEGRAMLYCSGYNNTDSDAERFDLWVECVGKPEAAEPKAPTIKAIPAKLSPFITDLDFEVDRPSYVGKCPVGLVFTGSITTSRAGTVKYRTVGHDGSSSPVYAISFGSAGTKPITRWGQTLSKPDPSATLAAGAGDQGPDYAGWRRLEIVEPAGYAPSSVADYSVTCREQTMQLQAAPVEPTKKPARIKQ
jgi:hypothetical protein